MAETLLRFCAPLYGGCQFLREIANTPSKRSYGRSLEDDARRLEDDARRYEETVEVDALRYGLAEILGFVVALLLLVFVVVVPTVQAFTCFSGTNLGMPGWLWGILILLFWPFGVVWMVYKGGCADQSATLEVSVADWASVEPFSCQAPGPGT